MIPNDIFKFVLSLDIHIVSISGLLSGRGGCLARFDLVRALVYQLLLLRQLILVL